MLLDLKELTSRINVDKGGRRREGRRMRARVGKGAFRSVPALERGGESGRVATVCDTRHFTRKDGLNFSRENWEESGTK